MLVLWTQGGAISRATRDSLALGYRIAAPSGRRLVMNTEALLPVAAAVVQRCPTYKFKVDGQV